MSRQRNKALIVYHKPGLAGEARRVEELAQRLREAGAEAEAVTIEEALGRSPQPGEKVFLLLFTRGGHWRSLVDHGYTVEHIPLHLTGLAAAQEALHRGYQRVHYVALQAHRLREEQLRDLDWLARITTTLYQVPASYTILETMKAKPPQPPSGAAVAPLALLRGRLSSTACSAAPNTCLGPFMDYGGNYIAAWILDRLSQAMNI